MRARRTWPRAVPGPYNAPVAASEGRNRGAFRTTRWSVVQAAGADDGQPARDALASLCESYWFPLYAYVRRSGYDAADAEDLTQGFFAKILERRDVRSADPSRGRFRSFLLTALKNYLADQRDREQALKRGGGVRPLSIDFETADRRYELDPGHGMTPERAFERTWALAAIERALDAVGRDYAEQGKGELFERLRGTLAGDPEAPARRALAEVLGMTEGALNVAVHRMRRRFGERLRTEVAETLADPIDLDREIQALFSALSA